MRFGADRLGQLGVDQLLKCLLHQVTEQKPDLVTAKLCNKLSQSGIMALGHRGSPFESTRYELAEDSTVARSGHGPLPSYTTPWDVNPRLYLNVSLSKASISWIIQGSHTGGPHHARRAALARGPDVWEIVARLRELEGSEEDRIEILAAETELHPRQIRTALEFAAAYANKVESLSLAMRRR
jgi:hypothetical protein